MKDPFIPYGRQQITSDDMKAVTDVLCSDFLTQGPVVPSFELAVASKVNSNFAVAVNSATSALHLACLALGLSHNDWLWTTPITFVASANCGLYCGAQIDFVDIDPTTGLISVECLSQKLFQASENNCLPKIIVVVHLCGTSAPMESIYELTQQYGVLVIEDASHAIGGKYKGMPVGNCHFSEITVFSFHPVKIITSGEGGMATTNNYNLAQRMFDLRSHGITKDASRFIYPAVGPWSYEQQTLGYNYRMTDIHAALGISQLGRLEQIISERHRLYERYCNMLDGLSLSFLEIPSDVCSALHLAVVRLPSYASEDYHRMIFQGLLDRSIGVQLHYTPVHLQPYYRHLGFSTGDFPFSEDYASHAITLPLYPGLSDSDQLRVVNSLRDLLS